MSPCNELLMPSDGSQRPTQALRISRAVTGVAAYFQACDLNVLRLSDQSLRLVRGGTISYVPQDPAAALNPALTIGKHLRETLDAHDYGSSAGERDDRVEETMREVLLPDDPAYLTRYPHQLSGGQQQRVVLAIAFACRPSVIVLDEPTTGLDVTTQAHVLATVRDLAKSYGTAAIYVTHDLAVVSSLADRIAVMYAGSIIEEGRRRRSSMHRVTPIPID
jgi:peptide/nickel transport system ATP-binding protein